MIDRVSRFPTAYALTSLSAKNVCSALMQMFQITGIPSVIQSDCGTNFTSQLTRTFLDMLECSPRVNIPGRPQQSGLCERLIGTLKNMISKVAADYPKSWSKYLGHLLWALLEIPNQITGVPPWLMVFELAIAVHPSRYEPRPTLLNLIETVAHCTARPQDGIGFCF